MSQRLSVVVGWNMADSGQGPVDTWSSAGTRQRHSQPRCNADAFLYVCIIVCVTFVGVLWQLIFADYKVGFVIDFLSCTALFW